MNKKEYKEMYCCDFKPSEREEKLVKRLQRYYDNTRDTMGNRLAIIHWKEFKEWTDLHGYTNKEINMAKRICRY